MDVNDDACMLNERGALTLFREQARSCKGSAFDYLAAIV